MEEALNAFRTAIQWDTPSENVNTEAYCALGRSPANLGRLNEALTVFRQAVHLNAEYAPAHLGINLVLASQNRMESAIKVLHQTLELEDDDLLKSYGEDFYADYLKLGQALAKRNRPQTLNFASIFNRRSTRLR